ncbi:MAG: hypothetical protein ACRD2C_25345 [Acidimicrobiales bacterium]
MPQGTGGSGRDRQRAPEAPRPEGYQAPDPDAVARVVDTLLDPVLEPIDTCGVPYRDEAYGFVYVG